VTRTHLLAFLLLLAAACGNDGGAKATIPSVPKPQALPSPIEQPLHVVTLGDSLAYGAGDESGAGIAGRLQDELHRRGNTSARTTNLGVNGAQTADLLARLRQERVRTAVSRADAIVLSIGANDLFRTQNAREETLRAPLVVAERILGRVQEVVREIRKINPTARILILGGYNPVPTHPYASMIDEYLTVWDEALAGAFEDDPRVSVVHMNDIVSRQRLSRFDNFHPGGAAYALAAQRIAELLLAG
jgi:lysophospholipase L1-like esterase